MEKIYGNILSALLHVLSGFSSWARALQLASQLKEIDRLIGELPVGGRGELAKLVRQRTLRAIRTARTGRHSNAVKRMPSWMHLTDLSMLQARSEHPRIRLFGLALWLTAALCETATAHSQKTRSLHEELWGIVFQMSEQFRPTRTQFLPAQRRVAEVRVHV